VSSSQKPFAAGGCAGSNKILHIINNLSVGGAESMLYKLLANINKAKFSCSVIAIMDGGLLTDRIRKMGVPVYCLEMRPGKPSVTGVWRLMRIVRAVNPDLIQGWLSHGNLAAAVAKFFAPTKTPIMWNVRQSIYPSDYDTFLTMVVARLCQKLAGVPVKIVYNSRISSVQHERLGYPTVKTQVIPNGFDMKLFVPSMKSRAQVRSSLGISDETIAIGLIGNFHPLKDHSTFLEAAAIHSKKSRNVTFILSGREVDWANHTLVEAITHLGLSEKVHLLGPRSDIPEIMAALDIACSSSYSEGFSNVIGEAMSCGLPCVVTDVGDSALLVGSTGKVVPARDPQALCSAWMSLIEAGPDGRRKIGLAARERISENFAIERITAEYEQIYATVARRR
jgi:glycosyltransferase involved in cell wall biosynthesis